MKRKIYKFKSTYDFLDSICSHLYEVYLDTIAKRNYFNLGLTGGNTPQIIYKFLIKNYVKKINWKLVNIFFIDERYVDHNDSNSNYFTTKKHLFMKLKQKPNFIYKINYTHDIKKDALEYNKIIDSNRIDLAILGMGEDGHVASIFPDSEFIKSKVNVVPIQREYNGFPRISMTIHSINKIDNNILIISKNATKLEIIESNDISKPVNMIKNLKVYIQI